MIGAASHNQNDLAPPKPVPRHRGHWLLGATLEFGKDPVKFALEGHEKYGDVFVMRVATGDSYFVRDPEIVNAINVTHAKHFYKPKFIKQMWKPFLGNGLVPNDGESWKRQHKLIMPGFHKLRIDAYAKTMTQYTLDMINGWRAGEERNIRNEMVELTLRVVGKTLFDSDLEGDAGLVRQAMQDIGDALIEQAQNPIPVPRWWPSKRNRRKWRAIEEMDEVVERLVAQRRREKKDRGDLMSHMVFAVDDEGGMSNQQLRDEMMTLIFAGHETTAHNLTWAWYLLATSPDKAKKAHREIDDALGGKPIDVEDLPKLPYLDKVVKESLRLMPAVWCYGREAQRDIRLGDYVFPKGATIGVCTYAVGRNAKYFDHPDEFRPERWTREFEKSLPKGAYVPFAAGPRVCLGKHFALMEMRIVLGTLLQNVRFNVLEGFEPDYKTDLAMHTGERGMPMTVTFRDDAPHATEGADAAVDAA